LSGGRELRRVKTVGETSEKRRKTIKAWKENVRRTKRGFGWPTLYKEGREAIVVTREIALFWNVGLWEKKFWVREK